MSGLGGAVNADTLRLQGRYHVGAVRTPDGWRIAELSYRQMVEEHGDAVSRPGIGNG